MRSRPLADPAAGTSLAVLSIILAMVSIQTGSALGKMLFPAVGAAGATTLRLVFASLILLAMWRPWRHPPNREGWGRIALYGGALGAMNLLFYFAIARIPLGIAVALEFTGPLAVAVFNSRRATDWLYVALAVAGLALLLPVHEAAGPLDMAGVAFALGAGAFWALYIVAGQRAARVVPVGAAASLGMLVATAVALPFGIAQAGSALLSPALLPMALGVALLSSAVPYSLEMLALKRLPPQTFSILMSGEPVCAALSGLILLSEHLTAPQWLATGLIIAASAGSSASARRAARAGRSSPP